MERAQLRALLGGTAGRSDRTIIAASEPATFQAAFADAVAGTGEVFLADPNWGAVERRRLEELVPGRASESGWLMIPTGGSGGGSKFARHDSHTIAAAVAGFQRHFALERVNALSVLPLHHVSGFMAWMRCLLTGGRCANASWRDIEAGRLPAQLPEKCCLSLVPTQLQRLLARADTVAWLRTFHIIFVGGGPAWADLLEQAAALGVPLAPSYGSTETAAMAAALTPPEFLSGMRGSGRPLPHCRIELEEEMICVRGASVCGGYYPDWDVERVWRSGDLGHWDRDGSLVIVGRRDDLVITGGEKVSPAEVEAVLRGSGAFEDVVVLGLPDAEWGQRLVACYPAAGPLRMEAVRAALAVLAPFKWPKEYRPVSPWSRSAQGKVRRSELLAQVSSQPPPS